jgi:hypothetical protein
MKVSRLFRADQLHPREKWGAPSATRSLQSSAANAPGGAGITYEFRGATGSPQRDRRRARYGRRPLGNIELGGSRREEPEAMAATLALRHIPKLIRPHSRRRPCRLPNSRRPSRHKRKLPRIAVGIWPAYRQVPGGRHRSLRHRSRTGRNPKTGEASARLRYQTLARPVINRTKPAPRLIVASTA